MKEVRDLLEKWLIMFVYFIQAFLRWTFICSFCLEHAEGTEELRDHLLQFDLREVCLENQGMTALFLGIIQRLVSVTVTQSHFTCSALSWNRTLETRENYTEYCLIALNSTVWRARLG